MDIVCAENHQHKDVASAIAVLAGGIYFKILFPYEWVGVHVFAICHIVVACTE
jgi:hypothetical protein